MQPSPERALVFTDIAGSTQVAQSLGDAAAAALWQQHDRAARSLLALHKGREIDRSDGFFLLFDEAADGAAFALGYHAALADLGLTARVGLHVGRVALRENPPDDVARGAKPFEVEGLAKPFAARLMALAQPGQTLLSEAARAALGAFTATNASWAIESHGHYRLKGLAEPAAVFEIGRPGACSFMPPADGEKAYRVWRADAGGTSDGLWRPLRDVPHNLPRERDIFIGRGHELHALAQRLDAGVRLLTLLGPGGCGKTRLARRYGLAWLGDWPGGAYFCDLSEARSLEGVLAAVAMAIGVPLGRSDPALRLGHAIAGRGRCLVILDNCEQVIEHAPATLGRWLDLAPDASFVVTSRERLRLAGEELLLLEPLPLASDAVELFAARARAQQPSFAIDDDNRAAVAEVVRLLDGLPLAIELAAARARLLSPSQLVERLQDRFALLAGARGAAARQATLRAAIDWSWDLLAPWEQAALAQCSVFEGGFTLATAERVLDLADWPEAPSVLDVVQALLDKSLLRAWSRGDNARFTLGEPHFGMYVSIHEYARERLQAFGEAALLAAERRHGQCFAALGSYAELEALRRHGAAKRREALAIELDNLVAACRRGLARGDADVAVATYGAAWEVMERQGPFTLGLSLGTQVLALSELPALARMRALATFGRAQRGVGQVEAAATSIEAALELARELGDRGRQAALLSRLGGLRREQSHTELARAHLQAALALARETGDRGVEANALINLGVVNRHQGRAEEARQCYETALPLLREIGHRVSEAAVLTNLAAINEEQGQVELALAQCRLALEIDREQGDRVAEGISRSNVADLLYHLGQLPESEAELVQALALLREAGDRFNEAHVLGNLGALRLQQGRLAEARADCERALVVAREVGNRRLVCTLLASLCGLHADQGRFEDGLACHQEALQIASAIGDPRIDAQLLGCLGRLRLAQGLFDAARDALVASEARLRERIEPLALARLLCARAQLELAVGDRPAALAAVTEASALAGELGVGPGSALRIEIAELQRALA